MTNKRFYTFLLLFAALFPTLSAQNQQAEELFAKFKKASAFDYKYPREKVYLHLDNSAYLENDTLWYKAYVVRASSLRPSDLSRVLYVELLNADGQLMEKQTLRLDSLGQADGCFDMKLPYRAGYYEIRAYTREMTNWGEAACFSRFFPLFANANPQKSLKKGLDTDMQNLFIPEPTPHNRATIGSPRPYLMQEAQYRQLTFYPEGGNRAKDLDQRIAFKITNGRGESTEDTLHIYDEDGILVTEAIPEHDGMGDFILPGHIKKGYAQITGPHLKKEVLEEHYSLPDATEAYTLQAQMVNEGLLIQLAANDSAAQRHELLGLAVINRERTSYFDTLTAEVTPIEILVPQQALRHGVNRIELFDGAGHSRATRLVWAAPHAQDLHHIQVNVKQNESVYQPFSPAVLMMDLKDAEGNPIKTTFSVAIRDENGNIVETGDGGIEADLLLSSEVKGYIHRPDRYFTRNDAAHRRMLDLLLMVQGWTASTFDIMCGTDTFQLNQPIEQKLILRGTLYKDNDKRIPQPDMQIDMKAYSKTGGAIEGFTVTGPNGKFAFESNIDFQGDFIAQFVSRNEKGKRKWGRLTLDRWFAPQPRPVWQPELALLAHENSKIPAGRSFNHAPETFEWKDTIPRTLPTILGEANVSVKGKYQGFTGNRYTWNGGEKFGMVRAMKYYNIEQEVEHLKDMGIAPGELTDVMALLESNFEYERYGEIGIDHLTLNGEEETGNTSQKPEDASIPSEFGTSSPFGDSFLKPTMTYHGHGMTVYLNNEPYSDMVKRYPELYSILPAEEIKSVSIVADNQATDAITGETKRNSRTKYKMYIYELPDPYRLRGKKGIDRRRIQGFAHKTQFYAPNYRSFDLPHPGDTRRTLHWAPSVQSDENGSAHLIFFTNARPGQRLDISIRGITLDGRYINYDYCPPKVTE